MQSKTIRAGLLPLATALLCACSESEPTVAPEPEQPKVTQAQPAIPDPAPTSPEMRILTSAEAPFACELLNQAAATAILGQEVTVKDITTARKADTGNPVESSCLYVKGQGDDLMQPSLRVEVWTHAGLEQGGWGSLDKNWTHRSNAGGGSKPLEGLPGAWAAWVESEHPPDLSLLVRQGEVMLELTSFPPVSGEQPMVPNALVEQFARQALINSAPKE